MTTMPIDTQGYPVPTLGYLDGGAKTIAITNTSTRNAVAISAGVRVISVYATTACYIRLGDNTVTAANTDHYIPSGMYIDIAIGPDSRDRYIATLRVDTDGTFYISERF